VGGIIAVGGPPQLRVEVENSTRSGNNIGSNMIMVIEVDLPLALEPPGGVLIRRYLKGYLSPENRLESR